MERWLYLLPGVLYMLVGLFLILFPARKPNTWYGYRTPRSVRDMEAWLDANRFAAWGILIVGFFSTNTGLTCALARMNENYAWATVAVVTVILSFGGVLATEWWVGSRSERMELPVERTPFDEGTGDRPPSIS